MVPVASSIDGVLELELDADARRGGHRRRVQRITAWTYNGSFPGVTMEVRPATCMKVRVSNRLPELPAGVGDVIHPR